MRSGPSHVTDRGAGLLPASLGHRQQHCRRLSPERVHPLPFSCGPCSAPLTCSVSSGCVSQLSRGACGRVSGPWPGVRPLATSSLLPLLGRMLDLWPPVPPSFPLSSFPRGQLCLGLTLSDVSPFLLTGVLPSNNCPVCSSASRHLLLGGGGASDEHRGICSRI